MAKDSGTNEVTGKPADLVDLKIRLANYKDEVRDVTNLCHGFTIYEDLLSPTTSVELLMVDAEGLPETAPIVGDEHVTITYRTRGLKKNKDPYQVRVRSFQIYKLSKKEESQERQHTYILHGVDDHQIMNEMIDLNQSYVGQNCVKAIKDIFKSNFIKNVNDEFRPYNILPKLYGLGTNDPIESNNTTFYIAPGVTPFESIMHLKEEAEHTKSTSGNNSDYVFYQDYDGFHITTMSELKSQPAKFDFTVKDMASENQVSKADQTGQSDDKEAEDEYTTVTNFKILKTFDTLQHLALGTYGNRVAAIDLLTKRFDEKIFSYNDSYRDLNPMDPGRLHSSASLYKFSGSTHTRYLPTELLSSSIPTGVSTGFNNELANYSQHPYFYPIDGQGKEEGTLKNSDAQKRKDSITSNDPKIANPRRKQYLLNKRIAGKGILDTMMLDIAIPGNSDIRVGDTINFYVPQTSHDMNDGLYNMFFGQKNPKFLIVKLAQKYINESNSYQTIMTIVKDGFKDEIETIVAKNADTAGLDETSPKPQRNTTAAFMQGR